MRRTILASLLLLALHRPAGAQAQPVTVSFIPGAADFIPLFVGADKGIFKAAGIDVVPTPVQFAANVPAAMFADSIDIGMNTLPIFAQARENGIDLIGIAGLSRDTRANPQLSLLVKTGSPIHTAHDLEGRKIAVPGLNSLFDIALMRWIDDHGADHRRVTFLEIPMPQLADVLRAGSVDAVALIDPFRAKAVADGTAVILSNYLDDLRDDQPLGFWVVRANWATAHKPLIAAFRRGLADSIAYIAAHPDEARQIGAKYLHGQVVQKFANWFTVLTPADLDYEASIAKDLGFLPDRLDTRAAVLPE